MDIKARMPGSIIDVKVAEGDAVKVRDILCVMDAMKMEQSIPCPKAGTVKAVKVAVGDKVKSGQVMFVVE
jgi:biotin carboxyl carrier protein